VPEYLAPGVYVEEVSFRAPSIEGVGTTTTGFAGPTLTGPIGGMPYGGRPASGGVVAGSPSGGIPEILTSFGDFQNIYGSYDDLSFGANYSALAVKAFFDNGGSLLYFSRVYANSAGAVAPAIDPGIASSGTPGAGAVVVQGRFPGAFLNKQTVQVTLNATPVAPAKVANLPTGSLLFAVPVNNTVTPVTPAFYANGTGATFNLASAMPVPPAGPPPAPPAPAPPTIKQPTGALSTPSAAFTYFVITVRVAAPGATGQLMVHDNLGLDPTHPNYLGDVLGVDPPRHVDALQNQIYFNIGSSLGGPKITPDVLLNALFPKFDPATISGSATLTLTGGSDGAEPMSDAYTAALTFLEPLEDIAIVATPGSSSYKDGTNIMLGSLVPHVERTRAYRVAILEAGPNLLDSDYEALRAQVDSSYAAMYVPWVMTPNPLATAGTSTPAEVAVPPTGFMAGIYARNDHQQSVAKAPANEVVLGAVDFERHISFAEQMVLNPLGINCLRFFPNRGYRVWGARTVSSDTEFTYINVRRYLTYLEHSVDNGTQWAVFENNGPALWARVKDSVDSFLNNEFAEGNLLGTAPSNAYFVRCDRTTMTQNDLDNGRLICLIGVALLKPAEFVIFRIGQMTANARS
jgi:phage tail sheath protein FI